MGTSSTAQELLQLALNLRHTQQKLMADVNEMPFIPDYESPIQTTRDRRGKLTAVMSLLVAAAGVAIELLVISGMVIDATRVSHDTGVFVLFVEMFAFAVGAAFAFPGTRSTSANRWLSTVAFRINVTLFTLAGFWMIVQTVFWS